MNYTLFFTYFLFYYVVVVVIGNIISHSYPKFLIKASHWYIVAATIAGGIAAYLTTKSENESKP